MTLLSELTRNADDNSFRAQLRPNCGARFPLTHQQVSGGQWHRKMGPEEGSGALGAKNIHKKLKHCCATSVCLWHNVKKVFLNSNYLRSSMSDVRLSNQAILSIKESKAESLDNDKIISSFAALEAQISHITYISEVEYIVN